MASSCMKSDTTFETKLLGGLYNVALVLALEPYELCPLLLKIIHYDFEVPLNPGQTLARN